MIIDKEQFSKLKRDGFTNVKMSNDLKKLLLNGILKTQKSKKINNYNFVNKISDDKFLKCFNSKDGILFDYNTIHYAPKNLSKKYKNIL